MSKPKDIAGTSAEPGTQTSFLLHHTCLLELAQQANKTQGNAKSKPEVVMEQTKEQKETTKSPARVVTFFLYSPDEVSGVGIRTDVEELGGWDTTLFIMEKKGPHIWIGTLTLPEGVAKRQNNVVALYKYLYINLNFFLRLYIVLHIPCTFHLSHSLPSSQFSTLYIVLSFSFISFSPYYHDSAKILY